MLRIRLAAGHGDLYSAGRIMLRTANVGQVNAHCTKETAKATTLSKLCSQEIRCLGSAARLATGLDDVDGDQWGSRGQEFCRVGRRRLARQFPVDILKRRL
jgi:hypothetical protein